MAVHDYRSENRDPNLDSNAGLRTPRHLRLRGSPPKKSPIKRTSPHKCIPSKPASASPRGSCSPLETHGKPDISQPATLLPAVIKLGYRMSPTTPPRKAAISPRKLSTSPNSPRAQRIQQQQPPDALTTWQPLPAFELLVPQILPYPPAQPPLPPEPCTPLRTMEPPRTPERCSPPLLCPPRMHSYGLAVSGMPT